MHQAIQNTLRHHRQYPPLENPRYASLDLWRGLACLMILLLHSAFYAKIGATPAEQINHPITTKILSFVLRMWIGVPMFFVISGYCISATADSNRRKMNGTADYFKRRLRRIFPPYWVALGLTIVMFSIAAIHFAPVSPSLAGYKLLDIQRPWNLSPAQWFGNLTLTESWRHHIVGQAENELILPSWTLCYEEQFYVVCGLLLMAAPKRFFSGALIISILCTITFALALAVPAIHISGFFFDGKWLMFAAGILVYYALNYLSSRGRWVVAMLMILGVAVMKMLMGRFENGASETVIDQIYGTYVAVGFALLILLLRPIDAKVSQAKILTPIALCGRMCYSLYLIHWAICKPLGAVLYYGGVRGYLKVMTITVPVLMIVSIVVAWVFYQLVERHFLNSRSNAQSRIRLVPITAENGAMLSGVGEEALN